MSSGPRARDLGIPLDGTAGPWNAITDVAGIDVGHVTLVSGQGRLVVGEGPVRTGVTAIHPRGKGDPDPVFAGWFALNGNGEMTGAAWIEDSGFLSGPLLITNTHSVGVVRDAVVAWMHARVAGFGAFRWALPVVAETYDGRLNDINGHHVTREHAFQALDAGAPGPVAEGNVGGGTGMICHGFKGGIGTASRVLDTAAGGYRVGALAQCNHGSRRELRVAGAPVGREITDLLPGGDPAGSGSIIAVVATDAPLLPYQLRQVARRAALGMARVGGIGENSSGDFFLAFSTANPGAAQPEGTRSIEMLPSERIDPVYLATVQAVEEAILNALVAAETMTGADDVTVYALPHDRLREVLRRYGRLVP